MAMLAWNPSWETGVPEIDRQHRELLGQIETLFRAIIGREESGAVAEVLGFLGNYAEGHFRMEEDLMVRTAYPELSAHRAAHDGLRSKVAGLREAHAQDPAAVTDDVVDFLSEWLISHIDLHDRALAGHLRVVLPEVITPPPRPSAGGGPMDQG